MGLVFQRTIYRPFSEVRDSGPHILIKSDSKALLKAQCYVPFKLIPLTPTGFVTNSLTFLYCGIVVDGNVCSSTVRDGMCVVQSADPDTVCRNPFERSMIERCKLILYITGPRSSEVTFVSV